MEDKDQKQEKVSLDDKELYDKDKESPPINRAAQKVELDLDDAPFLEEEKEEEKKEEKQEESKEEKPIEEQLEGEEVEEEEEKPSPIWKKWWFFLIIGIVVVGVLVFIILKPFKHTKEVSEESVKPEKLEKPKEIVKPEKPPEPPKEKVSLDPFFIEYQYKGKVRWLNLQFMLVVSGRFVVWEINRKMRFLRDAVYYYFKNKELAFLTDKKNIKEIKENLKNILNQYLDHGKIEKVLIQKYLLE